MGSWTIMAVLGSNSFGNYPFRINLSFYSVKRWKSKPGTGKIKLLIVHTKYTVLPNLI